MHDRPIEGKTTAQRLFLLTISLLIGAVGWFLMGEAESLDATETSSRAADSSLGEELRQTSPDRRAGGQILARVGGQVLREVEVLDSIADELALIDQQRQALVAAAVERKVRELLITQEARRRGLERSALVASEISRRLERISDDAVEAFYRQQSVAEPFAEAAPKIRRHLAMESFVEELANTRGVELMIEPSRRELSASR